MHAAITDEQTRRLAALVATLRPGWDVPGIAAAIHNARLRAPADELAIALIRLTKRDDLRTPAVLAEDGSHWAGLVEHARTIRPSEAPRCDKPGHTSYPASSCGACRSERLEDPNPRPVVLVDASQAATNTAGAERVKDVLSGRETGA